MVAYSSMPWYRGTHHLCRYLRWYPHGYYYTFAAASLIVLGVVWSCGQSNLTQHLQIL